MAPAERSYSPRVARFLRQRAVTILAVTVAFGALSLAAPAIAGAVIGTQGPSFAGANAAVPPSGPKPESKLWFNDGSWWGYLFDSASGDFHIFRFDAGTADVDGHRRRRRHPKQHDGRRCSGTERKLYVASHVQNDGSTGSTGPPGHLYRYSYSGGDTYSLDPGFPGADPQPQDRDARDREGLDRAAVGDLDAAGTTSRSW